MMMDDHIDLGHDDITHIQPALTTLLSVPIII